MHKQKKPIPVIAKWLVGAPLGLCIVALIAYVYNFYGYTISDSVEQWGQTGDYFGGILNPVLATASLLAVSYTLVQQFRESSATAASQAKQAFEQLLFELLRQHRHNLEAIDLYQKSTRRTTRGRDCIVLFLKWIKKQHEKVGIIPPTSDSLANAYKTFYDDAKRKVEVGHYFRNLYHLFKHIAETDILDDKEKLRYAKLMRAQLSSAETALLFLNCLHPAGEKFQKYARDFTLLQELVPSDLNIKGLTVDIMIEAIGKEAFHEA
jgi:hypothetical protein